MTYYEKVANWPNYYNNKYGDCTCAAAAHMIQNWTANASTQVKPPAPISVLAFYEHFVGSPPPPDEGCNMLSVLKYWRQSGLDKHTVTAFAGLDLKNRSQAQSAIYLLGSIYIGVALPDFAVQGDMLTVPWVVLGLGVRWATLPRTPTTATASRPWGTTKTSCGSSPGAS